MAVTGRSRVAFAEAEMRDEMVAITIENEFQMHAVRIVFAAGEAKIGLRRMGFATVTGNRTLSGHKA